MLFVIRFKSGKIMHFLRPVQINTGRWAIASHPFNRDTFIVNMNHPFFETKKDAEDYLSRIAEQYSD